MDKKDIIVVIKSILAESEYGEQMLSDRQKDALFDAIDLLSK